MPLDPDLLKRLEPYQNADWAAMYGDPVAWRAFEDTIADAAAYDPPTPRNRGAQLDGPGGLFEVRIYEPDDGGAGRRDGTRPVLVWAHGGGFIAGTLDMREADVVSRELCARAGAVVVSVNYHLATDGVTYPLLHQEVVAAARWVRANAGALGVDAGRLTVGGASAGGNLTLAAALELRALKEPLPAALALVYPAVHRTSPRVPEIEKELAKLPVALRVPPEILGGLFDNYTGARRAPFATLDGNDLHGLPRCLVIVSEYDDLRGSAEAFVAAAREAGVDVDRYLAKGMPHGHLNFTPAVSATDASLRRLAAFVASI